MAYCINCGRQLVDEFDFCPECGTKSLGKAQSVYTSQDYEFTRICPMCGGKMPSDAFYCLSCGATFDEQIEDFSDIQNRVRHQYGTWKNKWTALLLCVFLGWTGAHKYYEGKIKTGVLYTITFGLFLGGWVFDIYKIAFKTNPYRV